MHALEDAVADLHRAAFTGLVLAAVARRGPAAAAALVHETFRRQQRERFLPGLRKLGLEALPPAVACARYHALSNAIGGVAVDYAEEGPRRAWIRYRPPRWLWWGTALCAIPGEVSAAMLRGWHANNGVALGNPRLGFVCTGQTADGDPALEGYFHEAEHDLAPEGRLRFARHERMPPAAPVPVLDPVAWPPDRLRRARIAYAAEYLRSAVPAVLDLWGESDGGALAALALKQVGMQWHHALRAAAPHGGVSELLAAIARASGDAATLSDTDSGTRITLDAGWVLLRGLPPHPALPHSLAALHAGIVAAHDQDLTLAFQAGAPPAWVIRPR